MIKFLFRVTTFLAFAAGLSWAAIHFGVVKVSVQLPWSKGAVERAV